MTFRFWVGGVFCLTDLIGRVVFAWGGLQLASHVSECYERCMIGMIGTSHWALERDF